MRRNDLCGCDQGRARAAAPPKLKFPLRLGPPATDSACARPPDPGPPSPGLLILHCAFLIFNFIPQLYPTRLDIGCPTPKIILRPPRPPLASGGSPPARTATHAGNRLDQYGNASKPPFAGARLLSRFNVHCSSTSGKPAASYRPCRPRPYPQYVKERSNIPRSAFRLPHWFTTPPQNPNSYRDNSSHFFQPTKTGKKPS